MKLLDRIFDRQYTKIANPTFAQTEAHNKKMGRVRAIIGVTVAVLGTALLTALTSGAAATALATKLTAVMKTAANAAKMTTFITKTALPLVINTSTSMFQKNQEAISTGNLQAGAAKEKSFYEGINAAIATIDKQVAWANRG